MIEWIKPSGIEISTNELEETVEYCMSLGWKPVVDGEAVDVEAVVDENMDASGTMFNPDIHWKNRRKDGDGNWKLKKAD